MRSLLEIENEKKRLEDLLRKNAEHHIAELLHKLICMSNHTDIAEQHKT
jgi:hypothetical protein